MDQIILGTTEKFLRYVLVPTDPWFGKIRYELYVELEVIKTVCYDYDYSVDKFTSVELRKATPSDIIQYGNPYLEIQRKD